MKCLILPFMICLFSALCYGYEGALTPIERLRRMGKLEVLSGTMQIVHYGKDSFKYGSWVAAAYLGEAAYKISIDFSKAKLDSNGDLELPKPTQWCQINEGKTRMYGERPWTGGVITQKDKKEFANKQLACIDAKAQRAVDAESELMRQAQAQAERIARAYLLACGSTNRVSKVIFN